MMGGKTMSKRLRHIALGATLLIASAGLSGPAFAQAKLKWAHVYEVAEPYHTEALWAAEEIKKRTGGRNSRRRSSTCMSTWYRRKQ